MLWNLYPSLPLSLTSAVSLLTLELQSATSICLWLLNIIIINNNNIPLCTQIRRHIN